MLVVKVCTDCMDNATDLEALSAALASSDLAHQVALQAISCGETCARPARLWLQSDGGASYVFEGLNLTSDNADILATARAYLDAPRGWIEDARPCGRLRFCLTARLPA